MPVFPGDLYDYILRNTHYPPEAIQYGIVETVYLSFVISITGKVIDEKIEKSLSPLLDAEEVRILKGMPAWVPGNSKLQKCFLEEFRKSKL